MSTVYDTVWFDLDGTLIHTAPDLVNAVNATLTQHHYPSKEYQAIVERINEGAVGMLAGGLGLGKDNDIVRQLMEDFPSHYEQNICVKSDFFAGMNAIVQRLEQDNIPWGIVTNKTERYAIPLIDQLGLTNRIVALVCGDTTAESKPSPMPLLYACKQANVEPTNCIFIGDSCKDIAAGKACSMATVAAAYGYLDVGGNANEWQADYVIHSPSELTSIIWSSDD